MNSSDKTTEKTETSPSDTQNAEVLVREAGVPFQPLLNTNTDVDPISEWLSLMDVVQMLCPAWPVRDKPMLGQHWKL